MLINLRNKISSRFIVYKRYVERNYPLLMNFFNINVSRKEKKKITKKMFAFYQKSKLQ